MYGRHSLVGIGAGAGTAGLAYTGLNAVYLILAAFALIAVGVAFVRIIPKRTSDDMS